jgi:hypothetical protein
MKLSVEVRSECIQTVVAMITHQHSKRWLLRIQQLKSDSYTQDKVLRVILKVLRILLLLIVHEEDLVILKESLDGVSRCLSICPLASDKSPNLGIAALESLFGQIVSIALYRSLWKLTVTEKRGVQMATLTAVNELFLRWLGKEFKAHSIPLYCVSSSLLKQQSYFSLGNANTFLEALGKLMVRGLTHSVEALRTLQESLVLRYFCCFIPSNAISTEWFRHISHSSIVSEKELLGCWIGSYIVAAESFQYGEILTFLRRLSLDSNHRVQLRAFEACGKFPLCALRSPINDSAVEENEKHILLAEKILVLLQTSFSHTVGTVRSVAFRSLGELLQWRDAGINNRLDRHLLAALLKGCSDSKLAVRVQATWALTKFLAHISQPSCTVASVWSDFATWLAAFKLIIKLTQDSEKLLATALLALSYLLRSSEQCWFAINSQCVETLNEVELAMQGISARCLVRDAEGGVVVAETIRTHTQKVVVATAHTMGALMKWILVFYDLYPLEVAKNLFDFGLQVQLSFLCDGFLPLRIVSSMWLQRIFSEVTSSMKSLPSEDHIIRYLNMNQIHIYIFV